MVRLTHIRERSHQPFFDTINIQYGPWEVVHEHGEWRIVRWPLRVMKRGDRMKHRKCERPFADLAEAERAIAIKVLAEMAGA